MTTRCECGRPARYTTRKGNTGSGAGGHSLCGRCHRAVHTRELARQRTRFARVRRDATEIPPIVFPAEVRVLRAAWMWLNAFLATQHDPPALALDAPPANP